MSFALRLCARPALPFARAHGILSGVNRRIIPFREEVSDVENVTLTGLMDSDREMVMSNIARDRSPQAVQAVLEKALDRVTYRYAEACGDADLRDAATLILQTIKRAAPLVDSVGEVRRWQKSAGEGAQSKRRVKPLTAVLLAVGAILVLAVTVGLVLTGGGVGVLALLRAILPSAIGLAAVFAAGVMFGKPEKPRREEVPDVRDEFLVDAEKLWHHLKGMLLLADGALDDVRARRAVEKQRTEAASAAAALPANAAELFAGLLENAYAQNNADAREMIESMRFYLHGAGVEALDYAEGREAWFEFLPAQRPGTIRPALLEGDRLIKKGLASNG